MSARSAGLTGEEEDNRFQPDRYISPDEAQTILNRALVYAGLEERTFTFSKGDYSYIVSPYTIRADIAIAFDTLCREIPLSEAFDGVVLLDGAARIKEMVAKSVALAGPASERRLLCAGGSSAAVLPRAGAAGNTGCGRGDEAGNGAGILVGCGNPQGPGAHGQHGPGHPRPD